MCANWFVDRSDLSPDRDNQFHFHQLDNIGIQELLGVSFMNGLQMASNNGNVRGGHRRNQHKNSNWRSNKVVIQKTCDGIPIRKLYVTNIPIEVQKPDLFRIFGPYGHINQIYIGMAKSNSQQFAFITYVEPLAASQALKQTRVQLYGRRLFVNAADSWHQPQEMPDGSIDWRPRKVSAKQEENCEQDDDQSVEETPRQIETEINEGSLNMLNDDCLLHILSFLSFKELAGVERVCKRWQALSYQLWRSLREINFAQDGSLTKSSVTSQVLDQYLKRCGASLTSLNITNRTHKFGPGTLAVVAKHCDNLEVLTVDEIAVAKRSLAHLGRSCPRLTKLSLNDCERITDDELNSLLPKCADLKTLELEHLRAVVGKCLALVSGPVTHLRLSELIKLDSQFLFNGLQKMSASLESVSLNACSAVLRRRDCLSKLVQAVPNITSLALTHCCMMEALNTPCLSPLGQLKKLTSLDLYRNSSVNDTSLAAIVEGCEDLRTLNLAGSGAGCAGMLSETGISMLTRLRKLTNLNISYLEATNNTALKNFTARHSKLKHLECRGCPELGDDGAEAVVTLSNELELFDVSGCQCVTNGTARTAATSVKMRTNNTSLCIIVGGTQVTAITADDAARDVPLLTVDYRDLSEEHLRPDFMDDMFFPPSDSDDSEDLDHLCERIAYMFGGDFLSDFEDEFDSDEEPNFDQILIRRLGLFL